MYWYVVVILLCMLLIVFLLWREIKRPNKLWLTARIIGSIITVVSLACIALPVSFKRIETRNNHAFAIILTKGFDKDSVRKMISTNSNIKIFTTDKFIKAFDASYIPDLSLLSEDSINITTIHLFGYGLDHNAWALNKKMHVVFHPGKIDSRITSIDWTRQLTSGENLIVQGTFNNTTSNEVKIILNGFDTDLDSTILSAKKSSPFQLATSPRHIDKAVYAVSVISNGDTLETNPLPVEVKIPGSLKILLLAGSPDFENKFLRNWLSENAYGFAARTSISKNKYDRQYVNFSRIALDRITASLLENFDVVIADLNELNALPPSDMGNIRSYVENKGLGLIVKAGNAQRSSAFYASSFPLIKTKDSLQHTVKLNLDDGYITNALKIEQPFYIRNMSGTQSLIKDQLMRVVASSKMLGLGKVIFTTVPNTYAWWLMGNNNDYTSYWSLLLKKAAKKITPDHAWNSSIALPYVNEEMRLRFQTGNTNIPSAQTGNELFYPEQNFLLPYEWQLTYWPRTSGWQPLKTAEAPTTWLYIHKNESWQGIQATEKIRVTKKHAADTTRTLKNDIESVEVYVTIPKIYFLILFILFSGFLWFEKKYRNG